MPRRSEAIRLIVRTRSQSVAFDLILTLAIMLMASQITYGQHSRQTDVRESLLVPELSIQPISRMLRVADPPVLSKQVSSFLVSCLPHTATLDDGARSGAVMYLCEVDIAGNGTVRDVRPRLIPALMDGDALSRKKDVERSLRQMLDTTMRRWTFKRPTEIDYAGAVNLARIAELSRANPSIRVNTIDTVSSTVSTLLIMAEVGDERMVFPYESVFLQTQAAERANDTLQLKSQAMYRRLIRHGERPRLTDSLRERVEQLFTDQIASSSLSFVLWVTRLKVRASGEVAVLHTIPLLAAQKSVFTDAQRSLLQKAGDSIAQYMKSWKLKSLYDPDYEGPIRWQEVRKGDSNSMLYSLTFLPQPSAYYVLDVLIYLPLSSELPDGIETLYVPFKAE